MSNYFQENKYVVVKEMLSEDVVNIASQYALLDEICNFTSGDTQVPTAHSKYGDLLMESILMHIHPKMEYATGLTLIPTYSYYRVYRPGQDLKPHVDRESCEISTTICFNFNYQGLTDYTWPMFVETSEGPRPLPLEPGDSIIYRGCEVNHWRDKFEAPELSYHVQGFFHFVDANGPYTKFALDERPFIGAKRTKPLDRGDETTIVTPAIQETCSTKSYITRY